jgi:AhpD family alkylhydroperoxidase
MQARMRNPAEVLPDAIKPLQALYSAVYQAGVRAETLGLIHLRASQINGCSYCVDSGVKHARKAGESDERLFAVSAWHEAPYFNDAERAALALSEAVTRLADQSDAVPDAIWNEAAKHYDEKALAALVLWIATSNLYNRINVTTRQPVGKAWD